METHSRHQHDSTDHARHGHHEHDACPSPTAASAPDAQRAAKLTGQAPLKDPVCGMKVDAGSAAGSMVYEGQTYYFCSPRCLAEFRADPAKYLHPTEPAGAHAQVAGAQYTCPMHPEIVRDAPGSCPICGMALVPIAGTGEADDRELRDLTRRFWTGAALTFPLLLLAMAPMAGYSEPLGLAPRARGWVEFAFATPVVAWVGWPIFQKFWASLINRAWNMYTLIGLGVGLGIPVQSGRRFRPRRSSLTSSARTTARWGRISRPPP